MDAVAIDTFRNVELANATQDQLNQIAAGQTVGPNATGGWWGQVESNNVSGDPNYSQSADVDRSLPSTASITTVNGRDFGMLP